jgi:hypothetical protein
MRSVTGWREPPEEGWHTQRDGVARMGGVHEVGRVRSRWHAQVTAL